MLAYPQKEQVQGNSSVTEIKIKFYEYTKCVECFSYTSFIVKNYFRCSLATNAKTRKGIGFQDVEGF
jgi:hypothetical protein